MYAIRDKEVSTQDVERVIEHAKPVNVPTDQKVLHMLIQEYLIDSQEDVRDPIGMSGQKLEVRTHVVTGAESAVQNIIKCIRRCGLEVNELVVQPLSSSLAVLTEDEKELGVVLVDIGGGTTDIAIYCQGSIRHTAVIPIAGDQITNDIAMALRTPTIDAEDLKIAHGIARQEMADPAVMIDVPGVGDREPRPMSKQALAAVIEPRVEELFTLVRGVVRDSGYEDMVSSGIVLTGGTSLMPGMVELAEQVFLRPARIGTPEYRGHLHEVLRSPRFATSIGLLMEGQAQFMRGRRVSQSGALQAVVSRMKEWFAGNF
jgi:cell division protein FtsA